MREVSVSEITKNIREMCIEANHFLSPDMKRVFDEAVSREESPLGKPVSYTHLTLPTKRIGSPSARIPVWLWYF